MSINYGIITTRHRVAWVQDSLFPLFNLSQKAAARIDNLLLGIITHRYPHKRTPNAIAMPCRVLREACCHNRQLAKDFVEFALEAVTPYNSEERIATAFSVADKFRQHHLKALGEYNPGKESLFFKQPRRSNHPFLQNVPVNVAHMAECRTALLAWIAYLSGISKTKPDRLHREVSELLAAERTKIWRGSLRKNSIKRALCSQVHSPKKRVCEKLHQLLTELDLLLDVAANNESAIPMNYVQSDSGRWYARGSANLQSCMKLNRKICLPNSYEYDIRSCNQTVALEHAKTHHLPCDAILDYVSNKDKFMADGASTTDLCSSTLKQVLLALGFGAMLPNPSTVSKMAWRKHWSDQKDSLKKSDIPSVRDQTQQRDLLLAFEILRKCDHPQEFSERFYHSHNSKIPPPEIKQLFLKRFFASTQMPALPWDIPNILINECNTVQEFIPKYQSLYDNNFVRQYAEEMQSVGEHMLQNAQRRDNGAIVNAAGIAKAFTAKQSGKAKAHLFQAIESIGMQTMYSASSAALLPIHDAIVCAEPININAVESEVLRATGVRFKLKETRLYVS